MRGAPDGFVIRYFKQEFVTMSEEVVTCITNTVLWKSRILYNTTFHFSFSRLPFISDAPKYGARPMLRESVNHDIRLFTIRHMLRDSSIVVCPVVCYSQTECHRPRSYFSSYSGCEDGILTRLRAGWPGVQKKKTRRAAWDYSLSQISRLVPEPIQTCIERIPVFFLRGEAAGLWCWPLIPSSCKVKNECTYSSILHICLSNVHGDNFYLYFHIWEILVSESFVFSSAPAENFHDILN
jgi:hypothetical protein